MFVHQNASFHEHELRVQPRFTTTRPLKTSCRGIGRPHRGMIMKKIILATLAAATVMTPVVAQAATVPVETSRNALQMQDQASFQRGEGRDGDGRRGERRRGGEGQRGGNQGWRGQQDAPPQAREERPEPPRTVRTWSQERRNGDDNEGRYSRRNGANQGGYQPGGYQQRDRDDDGQRNWNRSREGSIDRSGENYRGGNRSWSRDDDNRGSRWNQSWRNDRRYDWRGHRERYRNYYSPGRYYAPYRGHSYRRFGIGINIGSGYYGSRYWISDPSYYRLPPAYGPYRWVRYYDDVLLIDLRSGRVVDAIHDFFW
jgi:opacity protein-like surface antigen